MKKILRIVIICAVVAALSAGVGAYAATALGTEHDPLITLSYLEQVLQPKLKAEAEQQTRDAIAELETRLAEENVSVFRSVTVPAGKTMTCDAGCEILVRSGDGYVTGKVLNLTGGQSVADNTWLLAHNLYLAAEDGATLTASADTTLMVRGGYAIN